MMKYDTSIAAALLNDLMTEVIRADFTPMMLCTCCVRCDAHCICEDDCERTFEERTGMCIDCKGGVTWNPTK